MFEIIKYTPEHSQEWNDFVAKSKNGTFLFDRRYMDYHSDRFEDFSLLFYLEGKLFALLPANSLPLPANILPLPANILPLPANILPLPANSLPLPSASSPSQPKTLSSHGGLTYGGLVMDEKATTEKVCILFQELKAFLKEQGFSYIIYKCVPHIYHRQPAEEDLYALFKECDARLFSRCISSTIQIQYPVKWRYSRKYELNKARKAGLTVEETDRSEDFAAFWQILSDNLQSAHNVSPVHSLSEIMLLKQRFPKNIRLFVAKKDCRILAGILVYVQDSVVHSQYISASTEGKRCGAVDIVMDHLLHSAFSDGKYFDFGHSTERNGRFLNAGLALQKEGFGGRGVCYDTYVVNL